MVGFTPSSRVAAGDPKRCGRSGPDLGEVMARHSSGRAPTLFSVSNLREPLDREFHGCNLGPVGSDSGFTVAGLFAGIGGVERGLARAGGEAELLCEWWEPARAVLAKRF